MLRINGGFIKPGFNARQTSSLYRNVTNLYHKNGNITVQVCNLQINGRTFRTEKYIKCKKEMKVNITNRNDQMVIFKLDSGTTDCSRKHN